VRAVEADQAAPVVDIRRPPGRLWLHLLVVVVVAAGGFGVGAFTGRAAVPTTAATAASPAGHVDIGFCQDMAVHHSQAVLMAEDALSHSTTPSVLLMAREILTTQAQERGTMAGWLTLWNSPQLPSGPPMTWMSASAMVSVPTMTSMPGMATQADIDRLGRATGKRFDILFLQLMIRHHDGGIIMAADARDHASLPAVRALAGAMVLDQYQENAVMGQLLTADGGKPLPLR
jgi:uncharacterized protein (DUF305 family)